MHTESHQKFLDHFGKEPEVAVRAPGRINLIGEHVDYLDGLVMPVAINKYIEMAAAQNGTREIRVFSEVANSPEVVIPLDDLFKNSESANWTNYISGVIALMQQKGFEMAGFDAYVSSTLPLGAGLSSSAALTTATALCIEALTTKKLEPNERALLCQNVEHEFAGVPCGIMDQLAVGLSEQGKGLLIDCQSLRVENVEIPEELDIVVCDSGVQHALADGEYKRRREQCEEAIKILETRSLRRTDMETLEAKKEELGDILHRRARHVISEIERVREFASALQYGNMGKLGRLMWDSHFSLRDDYEVSCKELDQLVKIAYDFGSNRGLVGSRMTGGGFGGSTVSLVKSDASQYFISYMKNEYKAETGKDLSIFITKPSKGAGYCTLFPIMNHTFA